LKDLTSYAMSYKIDANNKTAETVWKYGNKDYFSYALSSFEVLDNSKIINFGWNLEEMDAKGCTQFGNSKQQTFFIELNDKDEILFRANIKEGKFEAIKTSYYNNDNEYEIKDTKYLSTVAPTDYKKLSYSDTKKYKDVEVLPI
ncbi:MAG: aryl-sulfate sulfotransferase, partial [Bacilli bacterium]